MNYLSKPTDAVSQFDSSCFVDNRGVFLKVFDAELPQLHGFCPQQVNHVRSSEKYTLRGLHYQIGEYAEVKFFRVLNGAIQLAWVDLRKLSAGARLPCGTAVIDKAESGVLVPRGFATGYLTLAPNSEVLYLSDNAYAPESERGLRWNDPILDIGWHFVTPIVSDKDAGWPLI